MKATVWIYNAGYNTSEDMDWFLTLDRWAQLDLHASEPNEAISCVMEVDGSLPEEGELLTIDLVKRHEGAPVEAYVLEIDHPIFPEVGVIVCKTYIHAFVTPPQFEQMKSATGWEYSKW